MTLQPPLKWAGGKRWLVPILKNYWETYQHCRLVEPFVGGMAVTLGLNPKHALLNDINPHLINFYTWLKHGIGDVTFTADENDETIFYGRRDRFNDYIAQQNSHSREAAILFYYLNRTCFNGLCRFNRKGFFNVPFGIYKTINYLNGNDFAHYQAQFTHWQFSRDDFARLTIEPNDFIYADPPYDVPFTSYSQEDFTWHDQERFIEWLQDAQIPSSFLIKRPLELSHYMKKPVLN
jgi:DNA adenine methylase